MDRRANSDVFFLPDEKFDFDVSLSPASSKGDEDEDEVFVGPVGPKERCVSVNVESRCEDGGGVRVSWSPLTGDQLEAVCQEAHRLASQLQSSEPSRRQGDADTLAHGEEFVQDAEAKLDALGRTASALSPIKRKTFCVQDSPMKLLPPTIQRRLLEASGANAAPSIRPAAAGKAPSTRPAARLSTSSPVASVKAQPRTRAALRGKAALGVGVVLPSKPAAPPTSCSAGKSRADKTRLQPPSKAVGGWRRSPTSRPSSRAESYEDLLSDSTSVASDLSDCSLNSSLLGKRTLAPPSKSVRSASGVKAPPLPKRKVTDRKNTSSSSSSMSSFNSSMSVSPAKGKLNSSLNRSLSVATGPTPSSINRPTNQSKPRRSSVYAAAAEPAPSAAGRRSLSAQARRPSEADRVKTVRSTPLRRAEATPSQLTPARRVLERTASVPPTATVRPQSASKAKPKPEAQVQPTPGAGARGVQRADDVSKMLKPKRLVSASGADSLPQRTSAGSLTPSAGGGRSLQAKAHRPSALPTPVRHRMSAIPTPTPANRTRPAGPPPTSAADPAPCSAGEESSCSPAPGDVQEADPVDVPVIQPFCLEEEEEEPPLPAAPPPSAPRPDPSESVGPAALTRDGPEPRNLIELDAAEESGSKTQEVLLLDLPAPALQPQEKLLIDLTNTPDLIRTAVGKVGAATQLIDLSSPLIKWSPEDKRENSAPLINLSF